MIPLPAHNDLQPIDTIPKMAEEAREQCRLVAGLRKCWKDLPDTERLIVFAIPNGGKRNAMEGANLKAQGVKAGIPDLCIILPNKTVIWVEMKAKDGHLSDAQEEMHKHMNALRHDVITAYSAEDAINRLERVLNERK